MATVTRETETQTVTTVTSVTLVLSPAEAQRIRHDVNQYNTVDDNGTRFDVLIDQALTV